MADSHYAQEEWRAIPGAPDYAASSEGRIRRVNPDSVGREPRILVQAVNSTGRAQVSICRDKVVRSEKVHRLVALAFHGKPENPKAMVCHRDGAPLNNRPENLYWGDARTNGADAVSHGTIAAGARNGNSKLDAITAAAIRADKRSSTIIAQETGVHYSTVCRIRRGKTWAHI